MPIDPIFAHENPITLDPRTWAWADANQIIATMSVLTFALVVAAAWVAYHQWQNSKEDSRQRWRPHVIVDVFLSHGIILRLEVKNVGATIARNVVLEFDPPLEAAADNDARRIADVPMFARGLPSLAPDKRHTVFLDTGPERKEAKLPDVYTVGVSYKGPDGYEYTEELTVDIGLLFATPDVRDLDMHDLVKEVEGIRESLP